MLVTRRSFFVLAAAIFFASRSAPAMARILIVPLFFPTIQAAVDAAQDGDTVRVLPGTYPESVVWASKRISVLGASPNVTIVDPSLGPGGRCFTITNVPSDAVASGFTCQHGSVSGDDGGGMLLQNASLTVRDFVFAHNTSVSDGGGGGGVRVQGGSPAFRDVQFLENEVDATTNTSVFGGGMYVTAAVVTLERCTFDDNAGTGAGLALNGDATLVDCAFHDNIESDRGGGGAIDVEAGSMTATRCTFDNNLVSSGGVGRGGAVNGTAGSATFVGCSFRNNQATGRSGLGGAINGFDTLTVLHSDFTGNTANDDSGSGGAINTSGTLTVAYCSFDDNEASIRGQGGAIRAMGPTTIANSMFRDNVAVTRPNTGSGGAVAVFGDATITNCLFFGNQSTTAKGGGLWVTGGGNARVLHSLFTRNIAVQGGAVAIDAGSSATIINSILIHDIPDEIHNEGTLVVIHSIVQGGPPGSGNMDADPLFVAPQNDDFHLRPGSPAIDAGTVVPDLPPRDLDDHPRVSGPRPDMGPYERCTGACPG